MAFAITNIADTHQERKHLKKMLALAERRQALGKIVDLDAGDGVRRDTFVLAVLEQLGVLDRDLDIIPWIKVQQCITYSGTDATSLPTNTASLRNSRKLTLPITVYCTKR
jgi:hypothetical protein